MDKRKVFGLRELVRGRVIMVCLLCAAGRKVCGGVCLAWELKVGL